MGLFDFFKPGNKNNSNNQPAKKLIAPDANGDFALKNSDFFIKTHSAKVISTTVSADFYELFPEAAKPVKKGGKVEVRFSIVDVLFWGKQVEVTFNTDEISGDLDGFINKVNSLLNWLIKNKKLVDEVIIRDLLPLKNDNWLDEGETVLNAEELLNALSLTSIGFDEETNIDLHYDDGDLFGGHTVVVLISAKRKVKEASIEG